MDYLSFLQKCCAHSPTTGMPLRGGVYSFLGLEHAAKNHVHSTAGRKTPVDPRMNKSMEENLAESCLQQFDQKIMQSMTSFALGTLKNLNDDGMKQLTTIDLDKCTSQIGEYCKMHTTGNQLEQLFTWIHVHMILVTACISMQNFNGGQLCFMETNTLELHSCTLMNCRSIFVSTSF
jgi:hypothetical protein